MHTWRARTFRASVLVAGLVLTQFILFGPSLIGRKILLPLDILAQPACYLSPSQAAAWGPPYDPILSDPVLDFEMERRFAVSEIRASRLPLWDPHEYCGAPFLAANQSSVFSPFRLLDYLWPGPVVIAWDQLLRALVAGIGAYFFCRISLGSAFVPALIGAWIWPLCGFYIQWAGAPLSASATWLPWLFLFTDAAVRQPQLLWGIALALATAASLVSGHAETTGQILLAAGLFFLWQLFTHYGSAALHSRAALAPIAGVLLGILLSAPQTLPTLAYLRTSHRITSRLAGAAGSETPSVGFKALPQLLIPDFNGSTRRGAYYFGDSGNLPESASVGYVGLITALLLAPLAAASRRHRSFLFFFAALALLGMGQILGLPPLKQLYDSFPLNLMRENRLALLTGWSITMTAVIGLQTLQDRQLKWTPYFWLPAAAPVALGAWCVIRALSFPDLWQQFLTATHTTADSPAAQKILRQLHAADLVGLSLCILTLILWLAIWRGLFHHRWFLWTVGLLAVAEVIVMSYNIYPQTSPALYYPPQPMLQYLVSAPPGRVCAYNCLPACLTETYNLLDVRGYDGVDPDRLVDLLLQTQPKLLQNAADEAGVLQIYFPHQFPSPITRMINLRYLILPGSPPPTRHPHFVTEGYWLYENKNCLPRVFIPRHAQQVADPQQQLKLLADPHFDPQNIAYVESPIPIFALPSEGSATIVHELPSHLTIAFNMQTPGLIVLSDLWDTGWQARVNGQPAPVLITNHAFRSVLVPAGQGTLQFDYHPQSFYIGLWLALAAAIALTLWTALSFFRAKKRRRESAPPLDP